MREGTEELLKNLAKDAKGLRVKVEESRPDGEAALARAPKKVQKLVAFMMANGKQLEDIADAVSLSVDEVVGLRQSADFRVLLVQEARKVGPNAVNNIFVSAMSEAALGIVNLVHTATGKVKLDACSQILNRAVGTPVGGKPLDMGTDDSLPADPVEANEKLDADIQKYREELHLGPEEGPAVGEG